MTSIVGKIVHQAEFKFALLAVDADGTLHELWALNYRVVGEVPL